MTDEGATLDRRSLLGAIAGAGTASLAGCSMVGSGGPPTGELDEETARSLATQFAPTLYFDRHERWFPTDPRPYESEQDGETVVDGFDAFDGYVERFGDGSPPDPTVFYHGVRYEDSSLAVVQFWLYSAFDQFTTNFHWHDWEVLHVFVDLDTEAAQLYVASSHSRNVPNNEFLDPETRPRILPELGSHSSALSVNDQPARFQRFPIGEGLADITNSAVGVVEALSEFPAAYGLPRDEGARLPFLVPELDGKPVYDHPKLPSVERSDLIDPALTVRSFDALESPPADLPGRETGFVMGPPDGPEEADLEYELSPTSEVEHIDAFTGPQLSFEFAVPGFAEDLIKKHITTTGVPWDQGRYGDPLADVTDPKHRAALAERYDAIGEGSALVTVVGLVSRAVESDEAPDGKGLATESTTVESVALLESEPTAVPTFGGVAMLQDVPEGEHQLVVNGAGSAPHAEPLTADKRGETAIAGVEGEIPLVAREHATKLGVDPEGSEADLTDFAVEDDFAGRLYDAPLSGPDAVYVHAGGAYTAEVQDAEDEVGAYRVVPEGGPTRIKQPRTGKVPLANYLADIASETRADVLEATEEDNGDDAGTTGPPKSVQNLAQALAAVAEAARRAAERAEAEDRAGANKSLEAVQTRLERVAERLSTARSDLPSTMANAVDQRLTQANRRAEQARASDKL